MLKELKRQAYLSRWNLPIGTAVGAGAALFAMVLMSALFRYTEREAIYAIGSNVFMGAAGIFSLVLALLSVGSIGNQCLKSGAVRHRLYPALFVLNFASTLVLMLLALFWGVIDKLISLAFGLSFSGQLLPLPWYLPLAAALGISLLGTWLGAIWITYGKKAFWAIYAGFILLALLVSRVATALAEGWTNGWFARTVNSVAAVLTKLPIPGLLAIAILFVGAMALHTWRLLRRMRAVD